MKIIKIGIQKDGYPIWLEGEIELDEIRKLIALLEVILENKLKGGDKK